MNSKKKKAPNREETTATEPKDESNKKVEPKTPYGGGYKHVTKFV